MTIFRLNFSHGDEPTHEVLLQTIRQMEGESPHAVAVMGDLSGPKIRIGSIEPDGGPIREGEQVIISREEGIGTPERFSTNYPELTEEMSKARIEVPILSFCPDEMMNRQSGIYYGVINVLCPLMTDIRQFVAFAEAKILQCGWAKVGQQILILPGQELLPKNTNHAIVLHTLSGSE